MADVVIAPALASALSGMARTLADGGSVQLMLVADGDPKAVEQALLAAVVEVQDAYADVEDVSDEVVPPDAGEWDWTVTPAGIRVRVRESTAFAQALERVAAGLGTRGVSGSFVVGPTERIVEPPWVAPALSCRLQVAGRREERSWAIDTAAMEAALAAAAGWWRAAPPTANRSLGLANVGWESVAEGDDVVGRLVAAVAGRNGPGARVRLVAVAGSAFRALAASADGAITLVVGLEPGAEDNWRAPLEELSALLRELAPHLTYARILRGWDVRGAMADETLSADWPIDPEAPPPSDRAPFEDLRIPDAFGVQLLGPDYPERLPADLSAWDAEPIGRFTTLLSHTDPTGWFATAFVPEGKRLPPARRPLPPLLAEARAELTALRTVRT